MFAPGNSPPVEGWQAKLDGVVVPFCTRQFPSYGRRMSSTDTLGWLYGFCTRQFPSCGGGNSPPVEGCQAPLDGVVFCITTKSTKTVRADNSPPVEGWQAKLDGVVFCITTKSTKTVRQIIPLLWRGGRRSLTGWLYRSAQGNSPPMEGGCLVQIHWVIVLIPT